MAIDEKTRLDLRNGFEELLGAKLADAVMEAMPPLDYSQLATKTDLAHLGVELGGEMAKMEGNLRGEMASMLKTLMITQLATALALAGFVAGLS